MRSLQRKLGLLLLGAFAALGCAQAFLLPPFHVPDERRHWLAAHHRLARLLTGSGRVCSTDVALDRHFQTGIHFHPKQKLPPGIFAAVRGLEPACEEELLYPTGNALTYPGVLLSRLFVPREPDDGRQSLAGFYLARLLHGAIVALLLARLWWLAGARATGPPGLLALLLLSLSPLFVQQAFGVTNDVVTNAFALSLTTWLVFPERTTRLDRTALLLLGATAALSKPVMSVVVPPVLALGLLLRGLRESSAGGGSWRRALGAELSRSKLFGAALLAIALAGVAYAGLAGDLRYARGAIDPARQLEVVRADPGRVLAMILERLWLFFGTPRSWIDHLAYAELRVSDATAAGFAGLALGVGLVEAIGLGRVFSRRARTGPAARVGGRALAAVVLAAALVLAALVASMLGIGLRAYLTSTRVGGEVLYGLHPRYFFPHLVVALGVVMALARGLAPDDLSDDAAARGAAPAARRLAEAAVLALFALQLARFASQLAIDLLARF